MKEIETQEIKINTEIPMTYIHLNKGKDKTLLIFLHGYSDSARAFLRRAYPEPDDRFEILAVNGLFPVPQYKNNEWKQAFAWYFADFSSKSVLIHPEISAHAVAHLIEKLNLQNRSKIVIGFSQGGFFIPFILPLLKNVKYLMAIGTSYREQDYDDALIVPLDALHGTDDEVISLDRAETSFQEFKTKKNPLGNFYSFQGLKHTMNEESRLWFKNKLDEKNF
jgi:predicted esterase